MLDRRGFLKFIGVCYLSLDAQHFSEQDFVEVLRTAILNTKLLF